MGRKLSIVLWLAVGLLTAIFVGGCITHPPDGSAYNAGGTRVWKREGFTGAVGAVTADSYYFWRTTKGADGLTYEESGYYLVYLAPPAGFTDGTLIHWEPATWPSLRSAPAASGDTIGAYGWYAEITHPPDGTYVVCGAQTRITHPPDITAVVSSK